MSSLSSVGSVRPPPSRPPNFTKLDTNSDSSLILDEFKAGAPKGADASKSENLFKSIDTDSSGSVSKEESEAFKTQAQQADQQLQSFLFSLQSGSNGTKSTSGTDEESTDIFAQLDSNSDSSVSKDEFLKAISSSTDSSDSSKTDLLSKLFDAIDTNKDGSMSKDETAEFKDSMSKRGPPPFAMQSYGTTSQLGSSTSTGSSYSMAA